MESEVERVQRRFEIAVRNFATAAIELQANEKAYQAWYAASVIQEFGMSRVYREIHLLKRHLGEAVGDTGPWPEFLRGGNEVFPDLSVSWEPAIDARHSVVRHPDLSATSMINSFSIISELKVTGSTGRSTAPAAVRSDIRKLGLISAAAESAGPLSDGRRPSFYMVILDNHVTQGRASHRFAPGRMWSFLEQVWAQWPVRAARPTVMVGRSADHETIVDVYRTS